MFWWYFYASLLYIEEWIKNREIDYAQDKWLEPGLYIRPRHFIVDLSVPISIGEV